VPPKPFLCTRTRPLQSLPPEAEHLILAPRHGQCVQREAGPTQGVQMREGVEIGRYDRPCFTGPALGVKNGLGAHPDESHTLCVTWKIRNHTRQAAGIEKDSFRRALRVYFCTSSRPSCCALRQGRVSERIIGLTVTRYRT